LLKVLFGIYKDAGGFYFVVGTPYLYVAVALTYVLFDRSYASDWASLALGIFPSLIGFSLATFAIVLALFGSENLAKLATKRNGQKVSPLAKLTALIVHAALIQISALISAFGLKQNGICAISWADLGWRAVPKYICEEISFWSWLYIGGLFLTIYGLMLIVSTLLAVFQTSQMTR